MSKAIKSASVCLSKWSMKYCLKDSSLIYVDLYQLCRDDQYSRSVWNCKGNRSETQALKILKTGMIVFSGSVFSKVSRDLLKKWLQNSFEEMFKLS